MVIEDGIFLVTVLFEMRLRVQENQKVLSLCECQRRRHKIKDPHKARIAHSSQNLPYSYKIQDKP